MTESNWAWEKDQDAFTAAACEAWTAATDYAAPTDGRLVVSDTEIIVNAEAVQSLYDCEDGMKVKTQSTIRANRLGHEGRQLGKPEVLARTSSSGESVVVSSHSDDGQFCAKITSTKSKSGNGDDNYHLTVTDTYSGATTYLSLSAQKAHGAVCPNTQFGSLSFSPDGSKLLYVAEKKAASTKSYFPAKLGTDGDDADTKAGDEFLFEDSWGEQLTKFHHTVLVVAQWRKSEQSVKVVVDLPTVSAGQAVWGPASDSKGDSVVFIGWLEENPRRGLIYCTQRPSFAYKCYLNEQPAEKGAAPVVKVISRPEKSVRSPSFNPSGDKLVFLEQDARGPHHACSRLMVYDWASETLSVAVNIVDLPREKAFCGLYRWECLPSRTWSEDGKVLYLSTQWRSEQVIASVDVASGKVTRLSPESEVGSWALLDVKNDILLALYSNPSTTPHLRVCFAGGATSSNDWFALSPSKDLAVTFSVVDLLPDKTEDTSPASKIPFQATLISPSTATGSQKPLPLVVMPHGGPHTCAPAGYSANHAAVSQLGYCSVVVNYRGSSGFGQDSIVSLLGKVGVNDVQDVQTAAIKAMSELNIDPAKVFIHGGSHGGFLCAHGIGQFPTFYRAACIRNPVINLAAMHSVTDICDWTLVEAGLPDDPGMESTVESMKTMLECSPIVHINKVKAATLMLIGEMDHRVPPSQGHRYIRLLKNRNVKCRLLSYPKDCHPLGEVKTQADTFVNMMVWYQNSPRVSSV